MDDPDTNTRGLPIASVLLFMFVGFIVGFVVGEARISMWLR